MKKRSIAHFYPKLMSHRLSPLEPVVAPVVAAVSFERRLQPELHAAPSSQRRSLCENTTSTGSRFWRGVLERHEDSSYSGLSYMYVCIN